MGELTELKAIEALLISEIGTIVKEVQSHKGKPLEAILDIVKDLVMNKKDAIAKIIASASTIPAEIKAAGIDGWIDFVIDLVMNIIKVVSDIFAPVAPVAA